MEDLFVLKEDDFDAFVVGSDQVWRPMFYPGKIENAYLDFAKDWDIKRIAYAASLERVSGNTQRNKQGYVENCYENLIL